MHLYVCECMSVCHVLYIIIKHCFIHYYIYYYYYSSILGCTIIINCALKEKKNEKKISIILKKISSRARGVF